MKNTLSSIAKAGSKAFLKWIFVFILGIAFSLICLVTGYFLLMNTEAAMSHGSSSAGGLGAIIGLIGLFSVDFWPMLLITTSLLVFPFLYILIGNKVAIQTAVYSLWKSKGFDWLQPKINGYFEKLTLKQPNWLKSISSAAVLKLQLLDSSRKDATSSKWQKRILHFLIKKTKMNDIDWQKEDLEVKDIISQKINTSIDSVAKPSFKYFWLCLLVQLVLLILAFVLDVK